jgi:hypothetical protein
MTRTDAINHPFVKSGNRTQKRGCDEHDVVAPRGLKHQNARALLARSYSRPKSKKSPSGARRLTEDVKLAKVDPEPAERSICAGYDRAKH